MADEKRNQDPHRPPHPNAPPRRMTEGGGRGRIIGIIVLVVLVIAAAAWFMRNGTTPTGHELGEPAGVGVPAEDAGDAATQDEVQDGTQDPPAD